MDDKLNARLARREAHLAIWGNILLFLFKSYVGIVSGSVAIMADAWHTLSDSLSSLVLLVGVRIARRPADSDHPYGHGRAELIAALIIGTMLGAVALEFFIMGIEKLNYRSGAEYGVSAVIAMVLTVVVKFGMGWYASRIAKKTGMLAINADAKHHYSDALSSLLVLAGILAGYFWWWIDGALAMLVAVFIALAAVSILRDASDQLLGKIASPEQLDAIRALAEETLGGSIGIHHVHLHSYGTHRELTFHIRMAGSTTLDAAHGAANLLEQKLKEKFGFDATIHVEPFLSDGDKAKDKGPAADGADR